VTDRTFYNEDPSVEVNAFPTYPAPSESDFNYPPQDNDMPPSPFEPVTETEVGTAIEKPEDTGFQSMLTTPSGTAPTPTAGAWAAANAPSVEKASGGGYTAEQATVNDPTDTVEGRMTNLLSQESDYMKRAETKALQEQIAKGTQSSSMAIGATHAAAIDAALPIAQQDASTYAQFNLTNRDSVNEALRTGAINATQASIANAESANRMAATIYEAGASAAASADQNAWSSFENDLTRKLEVSMQQEGYSFEEYMQEGLDEKSAATGVANINSNTVSQITSIMSNPNMSPETMQDNIAILTNLNEVSVTSYLSSAGVDIDPNLVNFETIIGETGVSSDYVSPQEQADEMLRLSQM